MTRSEYLLGILIVAVLTVGSGVIHGRMSHRWGVPIDMKLAGAKLEQIPDECGPWKLDSSEQMDEEVKRVLECSGYILRNYVNTETGATVNMFVLLGPPGPTAAHTPDICYKSQDYPTVQKKKRWELTVGQTRHAFWAQTLESTDLDRSLLRVYHAWSPGDRWQAPDDSRFAFTDRRYLYKIQLAVPLSKLEDAGTDADPGRGFLEHFVAAAQPFLIPPATD